jgi:ADP-heptose:LPS heptosyltransferase
VRPWRDRARRIGISAAAHLLPTRTAAEQPPRRLLLIRPDHLGDLLLTGPALAALRTALPEAELSLLVGPWSEEVARRGPAVDRVETCPFPGFSRAPKRSVIEPYQTLLTEARRLRGRFDLAVILRPDHWWGALLAALAGVPSRLGYASPLTVPLLTEALALPSGVHASRLSLTLARRANVLAGGTWPAETPGPVFRLRDDELAWADHLLADDPRPLALLHPGSGSPLKDWPAPRWATVADALSARGARLMISGGPDDPATPQAVAAAMQSPALLLAGKTTLGQLGALCKRATLVLGVDSGPLHLAAALGTPTLRLYGPTDEAIFGPLDHPGDSGALAPSSHRVLTNPLACRPCGNLLTPPCGARSEPACLRGVTTEQVVAAALERWDAIRRSRN